MNREELNALVADIIKLRNHIDDKLAVEVPHIYPHWIEYNYPYEVGDRVLYDNTLYKVIMYHISQPDWTPSNAPSLFAKVLVDDGTVLPWEQPDSTNPYMIGDKVTHKDAIWVSTVDNNVWEPGVYGWDPVIE